MQGLEKRQFTPALKQIVSEASRALATLDTDRLEEMALSCQALNRDLMRRDASVASALALQAKEAEGEMATFARILEVTRANLNVMNRLRELREGRLEYRPPTSTEIRRWVPSEKKYGDD